MGMSSGGWPRATHFVGIVGKKWEPRNPVPGPFSAKIRKVNQNSESRREFGKWSKIRKAHPKNSEKIWKLDQNSESLSGKFGKLRQIRKVCPENSENFGKFVRKIRKTSKSLSGKFGKIRKVHPENLEKFGKFGKNRKVG